MSGDKHFDIEEYDVNKFLESYSVFVILYIYSNLNK